MIGKIAQLIKRYRAWRRYEKGWVEADKIRAYGLESENAEERGYRVPLWVAKVNLQRHDSFGSGNGRDINHPRRFFDEMRKGGK